MATNVRPPSINVVALFLFCYRTHNCAGYYNMKKPRYSFKRKRSSTTAILQLLSILVSVVGADTQTLIPLAQPSGTFLTLTNHSFTTWTTSTTHINDKTTLSETAPRITRVTTLDRTLTPPSPTHPSSSSVSGTTPSTTDTSILPTISSDPTGKSLPTLVAENPVVTGLVLAVIVLVIALVSILWRQYRRKRRAKDGPTGFTEHLGNVGLAPFPTDSKQPQPQPQQQPQQQQTPRQLQQTPRQLQQTPRELQQYQKPVMKSRELIPGPIDEIDGGNRERSATHRPKGNRPHKGHRSRRRATSDESRGSSGSLASAGSGMGSRQNFGGIVPASSRGRIAEIPVLSQSLQLLPQSSSPVGQMLPMFYQQQPPVGFTPILQPSRSDAKFDQQQPMSTPPFAPSSGARSNMDIVPSATMPPTQGRPAPALMVPVQTSARMNDTTRTSPARPPVIVTASRQVKGKRETYYEMEPDSGPLADGQDEQDAMVAQLATMNATYIEELPSSFQGPGDSPRAPSPNGVPEAGTLYEMLPAPPIPTIGSQTNLPKFTTTLGRPSPVVIPTSPHHPIATLGRLGGSNADISYSGSTPNLNGAQSQPATYYQGSPNFLHVGNNTGRFTLAMAGDEAQTMITPRTRPAVSPTMLCGNAPMVQPNMYSNSLASPSGNRLGAMPNTPGSPGTRRM